MSSLYEDSHRALHEQFDSTRIAGALEEGDGDHIEEQHRPFIESRDFFFLATVDSQGRPQSQYKGGSQGFVKIVDEKTLVFPSYDGNGRYHSMGNIGATNKIGMLFLDFETPNRLRLQGEATVSADDPMMSDYHEAELIVRVNVTDVIINCPRYIHKMTRAQDSKNVPQVGKPTPFAEWKRIDMFQEALPGKDQGRAATVGGTLTIEGWVDNLMKGEGA
jgi:predicted pyridoxine 5'-phosphate oxidase superfamily flavin-nucleotide-binding protein